MSSKRLQTATKFVEHYATHDNEVLDTLLADELTFDFSPSRSLDNAKSLDKAGYIEFKRGMKMAQTGYPLEVKKYIEGESANSGFFDLARDPVPLPLSYASRSGLQSVPTRAVCPVTFPGEWLKQYTE